MHNISVQRLRYYNIEDIQLIILCRILFANEKSAIYIEQNNTSSGVKYKNLKYIFF
jgi:hypothetical protein